ncbi:hypothetical protein ANCDUO_22588 [Ancylostoma duodenale]|uniref:7TM GPCR serpentine receptor class x (Srx) domain-containing protein n=1 Tax=Ancylostoma duodenale TaxID=51022 RepID=A0A0C2BTY2_9BILA|nr:hypothetical protein ANCDUO_22588 [Ancylostoma duodenale]
MGTTEHSLPDGCEIIYKVNSFAWKTADTACGHLSIFYLEYVLGTTVCVIVIVVNTITFVMIYKHTKSSIKATLFVIALIICYFISDFATTKWETFATTTLTLEIAHSVNGRDKDLCNYAL